jgi:hypothetical protein
MISINVDLQHQYIDNNICDTKGEGVVRPVDGGNFVA